MNYKNSLEKLKMMSYFCKKPTKLIMKDKTVFSY